MIHTILNLTRPLIVLDCETTGFEGRICELGFQVWDSNGLSAEWCSFINPEIPIPPEATTVHGITDQLVTVLCRRCKQLPIEHPYNNCETWSPVPTFGQIAVKIAKGFSDCDFAGKNIRFDLRRLESDFKRVGIAWSYATAIIIDAERLEQLGEPRSLSHLYKKHTGKHLEGAHGALTDTRASTEVIVAQLQAYREALPRDLKMLHEAQWPGWIDGEGKFRFDEQGIPRSNFGKHRGEKMASIPPSYWRWIIEHDFPTDVTEIAKNALVGKFPTRSS